MAKRKKDGEEKEEKAPKAKRTPKAKTSVKAEKSEKPKAPRKAPAPKRKAAAAPILAIEAIQLRAYFLAEDRSKNGQHGSPEQDWIEAERQLLAELAKA